MTEPSQRCDLCGLPLRYQTACLDLGGRTYRFCCIGCRQVFQMLSAASDPSDPSRFKETELYRQCLGLGIIPRSEEGLALRAGASPRIDPPAPTGADLLCLTLKIPDMWCPACAWVIQTALNRRKGVFNGSCSFSTDLFRCDYDPVETSPAQLIEAVGKLGYPAVEPEEGAAAGHRRQEWIRFCISAFLTANVMMLSFSLYSGFFTVLPADSIPKLSWPIFIMASIVLAYGGRQIFRKALSGFRSATFGMETLIAAGAGAAYLFSTYNLFSGSIHLYFDTASMLITLTLLGKMLERRAKHRVLADLDAFLGLQPLKVKIFADPASPGRYVSVRQLQKGDLFGVEAGEITAADGLILAGSGAVNESALTGEPLPRNKRPGDRIRSGAAVIQGNFRVKAEAVGQDSTLGQMIRIVQRAMGEKSSIEGKTDRLLQWFVPAIFSLAAGTGLVWFLLTRSPEVGVIRAVTVMVISCPCALGIAIPLARTAGIAAAGKSGILVRDFSAFEAAEKIDAFVFDKTGTLTEGRWTLRRIVPIAPFSENEIVSLAAELEKPSDHYIAAVIRQYAAGAPPENLRPQGVTGIACHANGVSGWLGSRRVKIGARGFLSDTQGLDAKIRSLGLADEDSAVFISIDAELIGALLFGDALRDSSPSLIHTLRSRGFFTALLSGDGGRTTLRVGEKLGVDAAIGEMLPDQKAAYVRDLRHTGKRVAMVGDGINDAPALAASDLGMAVYTGSHLGKETADITLMRGDPAQIPDFLFWTRQVNRKVQQNLWGALLYNLVSIPVAMTGWLTPLVAVSAMLMSSLTVIGNTLRLVRKSP